MPATATGAVSGFTLPIAVRQSLRRRFSREGDEEWALRVAIDEGWEESNARYLRWQRIKGRLEMAALMKALGIREAWSPGTTSRLMALATEVFDDAGAPETVKGARKYLRDGWYEAIGAGGGVAEG